MDTSGDDAKAAGWFGNVGLLLAALSPLAVILFVGSGTTGLWVAAPFALGACIAGIAGLVKNRQVPRPRPWQPLAALVLGSLLSAAIAALGVLAVGLHNMH